MVYLQKDSQLPYYAVIFTSQQRENPEGYGAMAEAMENLAQKQPGFLGMEHARSDLGITVSYWKDLDSIRRWKQLSEHVLAQQKGKEQWYRKYSVRVCLVEREYYWESKE